MLLDFIDDLGTRIARRGARRWIPALGALVGAGVFVFGSAVSSTTATQVANDFDRLAATTLLIRFSEPTLGDTVTPETLELATERIERLPGVEAAGYSWSVGTVSLSREGVEPVSVAVVAASEGLLSAAGASLSGPGFPITGHEYKARTMLLGVGTVSEFEPGVIKDGTPLIVDGRSWSLTGIVEQEERLPSLLTTAIVPASTASEVWPAQFATAQILIQVKPGTVEVVAEEATLLANPFDPDSVIPVYRPEVVSLRRIVVTRVDSLALLAGVGLLAVSAFSIAASELAVVLSQRREIALRMAMGSSQSGIAALLLTETVVVTGIATTLGTLGGLAAFLLWADSGGIEPVAPALLLLAAPVAGVMVGLVAGIFPAVKGARISPSEGVRA